MEGIAKDIFAMISRMPKDPTIEAQLKKNIQNKENLLRELDAKLQSAKKELELYEAQIIKCIEGKSKLSEVTLARMISRDRGGRCSIRKRNRKSTYGQAESKKIPRRRSRIFTRNSRAGRMSMNQLRWNAGESY